MRTELENIIYGENLEWRDLPMALSKSTLREKLKNRKARKLRGSKSRAKQKRVTAY